MNKTGRKASWLTSATADRLLFASSVLSLIGFVMLCVFSLLPDVQAQISHLRLQNTPIYICTSVLTLIWLAAWIFNMFAMIVYTKRRENWSVGRKVFLIFLQTYLSSLVAPAVYFLAYRPEFQRCKTDCAS